MSQDDTHENFDARWFDAMLPEDRRDFIDENDLAELAWGGGSPAGRAATREALATHPELQAQFALERRLAERARSRRLLVPRVAAAVFVLAALTSIFWQTDTPATDGASPLAAPGWIVAELGTDEPVEGSAPGGADWASLRPVSQSELAELEGADHRAGPAAAARLQGPRGFLAAAPTSIRLTGAGGARTLVLRRGDGSVVATSTLPVSSGAMAWPTSWPVPADDALHELALIDADGVTLATSAFEIRKDSAALEDTRRMAQALPLELRPEALASGALRAGFREQARTILLQIPEEARSARVDRLLSALD